MGWILFTRGGTAKEDGSKVDLHSKKFITDVGDQCVLVVAFFESTMSQKNAHHCKAPLIPE